MTIDRLSVYPDAAAERSRWIVQHRGPRVPVTTDRPYAFLVEQERFADGTVGEIATVFLTNRECPWRCVMCDLWRHTTPEPVAPGDIPRQIAYALERLPSARQIKLYNAGSFFDQGAIPVIDYPVIASLLQGFERVIVECHPSLVSEACLGFRERLAGQLEIAMGLETAHPEVLVKLNKGLTLGTYAEAAAKLQRWELDLRSFVLIQPPFLSPREAVPWTCRSIDFAQEVGAQVVALIPTRGGNGAMEVLTRSGEFVAPDAQAMEDSFEYGLRRARGRVFVDLWEFTRVGGCAACHQARGERLQRMNLSQQIEPQVRCASCHRMD